MKKIYSINFALTLILAFCLGSGAYTQTTYLNTASTLNGGNGSAGVTFNLTTNKNIFVTDIQGAFYGTVSTTVELWYNTTPVSGPPTISTAGGWVSLGTTTLTPSNTGFTGTAILQSVVPTNLFMPAGSNWGFFVSGVNCIYTTWSSTFPASISDPTVTATISGTAAYGGSAPNPTFNPRSFNGAIGYRIASGGTNDAATIEAFSNLGCPGTDTIFAKVANYGANQIDSVWVNWSKNGVLQTPIHYIGLLDTFGGTGANSATVALGVNTFFAGITDSFNVWTTLPNGVIDTVSNNDSTSVYLKPALPGGTYTIGGVSPDYATFAAAVADLNDNGVCGPVVFNVRQGTYTEQMSLGAIIGTSATNTITFQADPANTSPVIITYAATSTADNYVVQFNGAEYVTVDGLTITATGVSFGYAVHFNAANYVTVKNCEINTSNSTAFNCVPVYNTTGVNVEYCTIENNKLNNGYYGMYWYGGNTTSKEVGNIIRNNEIKDFNIYGMMFYYQGGGTIEGNKLEQMTSATSTSYGMYAYYNDSIKVKANQVILYGSGLNYGLYLYQPTGTAANKCEVQNNMITTSPNSTSTSYGLYIANGSHLNVYHNSINVRGGTSTSSYGFYLIGSTTYTNVDVKNNIFANSGLGVAMYITSGAISTHLSGMDYNIYTASSGNLISQNGTIHTTLASWITASTLDSNSISALPGFVSGTNLHLQGGVAADAGANVGVMIDIDGDARPILPSTGYDIGADEYIPPTCPMGYGLTDYGLTATTAGITWVKGISDSSWIFEYGAPGFTPGTGTVISSGNDSITITGLTATTDYCVYVRGICAVGDTSAYFGPHCFKTRCTSTLSGIYTINSALPTAGTNYASFAAAMNALNNCGISAPTTFHVKQGTYTEQVDIGAIVGTSSTNTITFKADPTNTAAAILTYAATASADNFVVKFDGANNIIFDSLTVNPIGVTYGYGFNFVNAQSVTVKNCNINCVSNTSSLMVPIYNLSGASGISENCTIENNKLTKGYYGIYWYGNSTTSKEIGNKIINNDISDFYLYGLMSYYQGGNRVEGNVIEQMPSAPSTSYGMYIYYNDSAKIISNKVTLTGLGTNYGIYVAYNYGSPTNKTEVINNMISTSPSSTGTSYGMYLAYGKHINIYHNSVHVQGGSSTGGRGFYLAGSTSTTYGNVNIRNNIFANTGPGEGMYILSGAISTFLDDMDNNIYEASSGNLINQNGTMHTSMASYITATALDSNSLNGFPGFISGTDLHVQGAIAYDNGDPTVGVMTDIDGDVRPLAPSTGWDIGADEYIPPTCPSPYSMATTAIGTTTTTIGWTNGPADSIWELQYGTPGFALGTGTTVSSSSNPATITGLAHSTCYEVWLRSICTVGDTSIWTGPFNFCTKCAPVADYCTSFESDAYQVTPFCWETYINSTSTAYIYNYIYLGRTGNNSVRFYNAADAGATMMLIAPEVSNLGAGTHRANFWAQGDSTIIIGSSYDPSNPGAFTVLDTLVNPTTSGWTNYKVDMSAYTVPVGDSYFVILWDPAATYDYLYIDDYCWEEVPNCEKAPAVTVLNSGVDSTKINIGWNVDTLWYSDPLKYQKEFIISYGPAGYTPGDGTVIDTVYTSTTTAPAVPNNFISVNGLTPLTDYCFWVKAICANGDTSFWSGPHCGTTGCPSGVTLPYFEDFTSYTSLFPLDETPQCWEEATGTLTTSGGLSPMTESRWEPDGFGNVGFTGAARFHFPTFGVAEGWILTPTFDFGSDPNIARVIEFDVALTQQYNSNIAPNGFGNDDTVALVVSYDKGITWKKADIIMQWDTSNEPSNTGTHIIYTMRNTTGHVKFGFYGLSNVANEGVEFFVDNFSIRDTTFVGLDETASLLENFQVYPNPNQGMFTVLNKGNAKTSSVKMMDIQGRMVYDNQLNFAKNGTNQIQVNNLTSGVYILLIQSEGKTEQHRIVIQ